MSQQVVLITGALTGIGGLRSRRRPRRPTPVHIRKQHARGPAEYET
jgi:hypothetical protein